MSPAPHLYLQSTQLAEIAQGQAQLTAALGAAAAAVQGTTPGQAMRKLVNASLVLRKHRQTLRAAIRPNHPDELAHRYLLLLGRLRRDINMRMGIVSADTAQITLAEDFEQLCWQTLGCGVLWLDGERQQVASQQQASSLAGAHWERLRSDGDAENALISQQLAHDVEIDQILYCSVARSAMKQAQLDALVENASQVNRLDRISGLLMYAQGVFVQLIEGPREAVEDLWERILHDPRHMGVVQIYHRREVESRVCEGWGMQHVDRQMVQAMIREAKTEVVEGRKTAWAPAIERMDQLLSHSDWGAMVRQLQSAP